MIWKDYVQYNYIETTKVKDISFRIIYSTKIYKESKTMSPEFKMMITLIDKKIKVERWKREKPYVG